MNVMVPGAFAEPSPSDDATVPGAQPRCGNQPHVNGLIEETIPGVWARYLVDDNGDVVPAGERTIG